MKFSNIVIEGKTVTPAEVEAAILKEETVKLGQKITVCHLTLVDGHEVIGMSGVVDPDKYDAEIGGRIARTRALDNVWSHMGSILQDRLINS